MDYFTGAAAHSVEGRVSEQGCTSLHESNHWPSHAADWVAWAVMCAILEEVKRAAVEAHAARPNDRPARSCLPHRRRDILAVVAEGSIHSIN
jgi:hypothetical protein